MDNVIPAGKFKAECLALMDQVRNTGKSWIITKRKEPVAKLVPIKKKDFSLFGKMKGSIDIHGDLTQPIDEEWDVCS